MTPEETADLQAQRDRLAAYIREVDAGRINCFSGVEEIMLRRTLQELTEALMPRRSAKRSR